jgi:hypothetical protein
MRRRVESPSIRNNVSLLPGILRADQTGEAIKDSMSVSAALIVLYGLRPICTAYTLESIVNKRDARAGGRGNKRDHQPRRMQPTTPLFEPEQNQAFLCLELEHSAADPRFVIRLDYHSVMYYCTVMRRGSQPFGFRGDRIRDPAPCGSSSALRLHATLLDGELRPVHHYEQAGQLLAALLRRACHHEPLAIREDVVAAVRARPVPPVDKQ